MTFDALVSSLYAAANGRADWSTTLAGIASYLDLWTVQVLGIDKRNGHLMFSVHGGKSTAQTALDYFRHYHSIDPRVGLAATTQMGLWFHCHEHFDDAFVAQSPFYQEFLIPHGGRYASATNLIDNEEVVFMLALMRGQGGQPLTHADLGVIDQFRHHFTEAMKNLVHTRETFVQLGMARELLDELDYPMVLVDETRGIWHTNGRATAMLQAGDVVVARGGMLACQDKTSDDALTEAIFRLKGQDAATRETPARQVVRLRSFGDSQLCLAFVSAVEPGKTMGAFGSGARALVILHHPYHAGASLDPLVVAECFDFTPAEARTAVQLAEGASAKEIAQRSGAALATVRTHIQRLLEKAGVGRQADLMRVLLSLPVRSS